MRAACIDIGSNTTRLLVAECDRDHIRAVHQERAFTRIGSDVGSDGRISALKLAEVGEVVAAQAEQARAHQAEQVHCVATAAIRRASNPDELVSWIDKRCEGLTVQVLSEQEEAQLAFLGAARTLPVPTDGPLGLVDVGGGSSELVVGHCDGTVGWWTSVPVGSGDLTAELVRSDPPSPQEMEAMRDRVERTLSGIRPPPTAMAMAVGGSATSLLTMTGRVLDGAALDHALALVRSRPAAEVAARTGLDAERVKLLAAGLLILREAVRRFDQPLTVGAGGLREGVLLAAVSG